MLSRMVGLRRTQVPMWECMTLSAFSHAYLIPDVTRVTCHIKHDKICNINHHVSRDLIDHDEDPPVSHPRNYNGFKHDASFTFVYLPKL